MGESSGSNNSEQMEEIGLGYDPSRAGGRETGNMENVIDFTEMKSGGEEFLVALTGREGERIGEREKKEKEYKEIIIISDGIRMQNQKRAQSKEKPGSEKRAAIFSLTSTNTLINIFIT